MDKRIVAGIIGGSLILIVIVALSLGKQTGSNTTSETAPVVSVREGDWIRGSSDADVTIIEYSDFQCPACAAYAPILKKLVDDYQGRVREVYRYFPLTSIHPNAIPAARAAHAAGKQGKFWEMGDLLYGKQESWSNSNSPEKLFEEFAVSLGLDMEIYQKDVKDPETEKRIQLDLSEAYNLDLQGTPSFYLNGRYIEIPGNLTNFKKIIDAELAKVTQSPTSAPATDASKLE